MLDLTNQVVYCNRQLDSSWIAQTRYYKLAFRASGRKGQVLTDMFGNTLKNITAVTDRHPAYFALKFFDHQICLAYILRELNYLSEVDNKQQWSGKIEILFRKAIHTRNESPQEWFETKEWLKQLTGV